MSINAMCKAKCNLSLSSKWSHYVSVFPMELSSKVSMTLHLKPVVHIDLKLQLAARARSSPQWEKQDEAEEEKNRLEIAGILGQVDRMDAALKAELLNNPSRLAELLQKQQARAALDSGGSPGNEEEELLLLAAERRLQDGRNKTRNRLAELPPDCSLAYVERKPEEAPFVQGFLPKKVQFRGSSSHSKSYLMEAEDEPAAAPSSSSSGSRGGKDNQRAAAGKSRSRLQRGELAASRKEAEDDVIAWLWEWWSAEGSDYTEGVLNACNAVDNAKKKRRKA